MPSALHYLELTELSRRIHAREISPVEATTAQLTRIEKSDGLLKSYAHMMAEAALVQAREAEAEIMRGEIRGPLHGVPIAVKDLCWTQGVPTAAGMTIYQAKEYIYRELQELPVCTTGRGLDATWPAIEGPDGPEYADFHSLRHSYLTLGGRSGIDLRTLQELAGHSKPELTARYSHRRLYDLAGAVDKLPNLVPTTGPDAAARR